MPEQPGTPNPAKPVIRTEVVVACTAFVIGLALPAIIPAVVAGGIIVFLCYKQDPKPKTKQPRYGMAFAIGLVVVTIIRGPAQPELVLTSLGGGAFVGLIARHLWVGDSNREITMPTDPGKSSPTSDDKPPEQPQTIAGIKWFAEGDTPQAKLGLTVQLIWLAIIFGMALKMLFFG